MKTLIDMGFRVQQMKVRVPTNGKSVLFARSALIRLGTTGRAYVFIAGYNQPASSWARMIEDVVGASPDTIVLLRRGGDGGSPGYTTKTTLAWQRAEVIAMVSNLIKCDLKGHEVHLVGHSAGAVLARMVAEAMPERISDVIQIAGIPSKPRTILRKKSFWFPGGLIALLASIWALLFRSQCGMVVPRWKALRALFTGHTVSDGELKSYYRRLVPDSAIVFYTLTLVYKGGELERARAKGWQGQAQFVYCPDDPIMNRNASERMAQAQGMCLVELAPGTPHCFTFAPDNAWRQNVEILKDVMARAGMTLAEPLTIWRDQAIGR